MVTKNGHIIVSYITFCCSWRFYGRRAAVLLFRVFVRIGDGNFESRDFVGRAACWTDAPTCGGWCESCMGVGAMWESGGKHCKGW